MNELNGKMLACEILITGLLARIASEQTNPVAYLSDFRDEIKAVISGLRIAGVEDARPIRAVAHATVDELFSLMKPPSDAS